MLYRVLMLTIGRVPALDHESHPSVYHYLSELADWVQLTRDPDATDDQLREHQASTATAFLAVKRLPLHLQAWVALMGVSIIRPWLVSLGMLLPPAAMFWNLLS